MKLSNYLTLHTAEDKAKGQLYDEVSDQFIDALIKAGFEPDEWCNLEHVISKKIKNRSRNSWVKGSKGG